MSWQITIGRGATALWVGTVDGQKLGPAQLRTLAAKLRELGATEYQIDRLTRRVATAWTDDEENLTNPGTQGDVIFDGLFNLILEWV